MKTIRRVMVWGVALFLVACRPQSTVSHEAEVREALDFLYASMPLPDSVDYPRQFWIDNIECTLRAREEMAWGRKIPEREFRHFVLPVRVNNENMDSSRMVFYEQLKARVEGMDMEQAVLEVNHWCHEHVTYTPSDERTSSPLASIRTGYGRCGEESTLLVAALRSICIPARQVYTPRWAHTDDNHAWVEAWVDGQWHFLGACEPEAVLDLGWFNAPASRSMLMHTKAFGRYEGPEDVMDRTRCYTEIAVTSGYAPVRRRFVRVVDQDGRAVPEASVEFKIYNYAEFYTFCTKPTDSEGLTSIEAGLGDLVAWAHKNSRYGFAKCDMNQEDTLTITLDHKPGDSYAMDLEIVPPKERNTVPDVTEEQRDRNAERLVKEDEMRNAYISTFPKREALTAWSDSLNLPAGRVAELVIKSRGNHLAIREFLKRHANEESIMLIESLSDKDLRDVTLDVLEDHIMHVPHPTAWSRKTFQQYVLCPRVANELLTPYRSYLLQALTEELREQLKEGGGEAVREWTSSHITLDETRNPQGLCMWPSGVWRHRTTDGHSLDIFYVSLCRTLGIPSRIDAVTGKVQYMKSEGEWQDVSFMSETDKAEENVQGRLSIEWNPLSWNADPKYYTHFTLSHIREGHAQLLNYPEGSNWSTTLCRPQVMDAGDYMLITGTRMADGSVLVHLEVQPLIKGQELCIPLRIREPKVGLQVIGSLNSESRFLPIELEDFGNTLPKEKRNNLTSILSKTGRGYYILGFLEPNNEPTNHALRDIADERESLEQWGGHLVLLLRHKEDVARFSPADLPALPHNTHFGIDVEGIIYEEMQRELRLRGVAPAFVIADTFNRVVFLSEGYTIGLGEQMARHLKSIGQ